MATEKAQFTPEVSEFENHVDDTRNVRRTRLVESARLGLTVLTLLMALCIVGTSGDTLSVYNKTHVSPAFLLPLWPFEFNLGPTIALVTCSSIITVSSAVSLFASKNGAVRNNTFNHSALSVIAPLAGFIAALVAMSFFYSINTSDTVDTLLSWSCSWADVDMTSQPHFDVLCKESEAGLYMMIALVPLQLVVLGLAGISFVAAKKSPAIVDRKGSPAMS